MAKEDTILFVDDQPEILSALRRCLHDAPFDVLMTTDPSEALRIVEAERPKVVVSDFYMPDMQGPELLEQARKIDPTVVPIILTGKPDLTAVITVTEQCGLYRFLIKPWDSDDLLMSLRNAILHHDLVKDRQQLLQRMKLAELGELHSIDHLRNEARAAVKSAMKSSSSGD